MNNSSTNNTGTKNKQVTKKKRLSIKWVDVLLIVFSIATLITINILTWHYLNSYNIALIVFISIFLFAIVLDLITGHTTNYINYELYSSIPSHEIHRTNSTVRAWKIWSNIWITAYFFLSIFPIFLSLIVIYIANQISANVNDITLYSVISLCLTAITFILRPKEQAYGYRIAFEDLNNKIVQFSNNECEWGEVTNSIYNGEKIITKTTYDCP